MTRTKDRSTPLADAETPHVEPSELERLRERAWIGRVPPWAGGSRAALRLRELVQRVAATPRTTLTIQGERGSGRRAVAYEVHRRSALARGPFRVVAAAALDERGLADELRAAAHGSLVLHDVERLGAPAQALLVEHLQERQGRALGREVASDAPRLIATTSRELGEAVASRAFRDDLHYRLNVLSLAVPALRERREDLPELAGLALASLAREHGCASARLDEPACAALRAHAWSGNLAELSATLERAFHRAPGGTLDPEALGLAPAPAAAVQPEQASLPLSDRSLRSLEEALIRLVLVETGGNRSRSARLLGVNRATLYNKLKLYGL